MDCSADHSVSAQECPAWRRQLSSTLSRPVHVGSATVVGAVLRNRAQLQPWVQQADRVLEEGLHGRPGDLVPIEAELGELGVPAQGR